MMEELSIPQIKQQLQQELGPEKFTMYLQLLKEWFGQRLTKQMFDYEVGSVFSESCFILHNLLMYAVLKQSFGGCAASSGSGMQGSRLFTANSADQYDNRSNYIIPPVPGEEPFVYPPNAKEYPVQVQESQTMMLDMIEQEPPPDCDWLQEAKVTFPAYEDSVADVSTKNRFPPWFAHDFQLVNKKNYTRDVNVVQNVTHICAIMRDMLERKPHLKQYFVVPRDKKVPYLTSGCSVYGRILVKAWFHNIQNVNQMVTEFAVKAVKEHIKNIVVEIAKQRRSFGMRDKHIVHSIGVSTPNPYLRQSYHLYDESYGTDTTKMADVVMQVPTTLPTLEEKERLAALQVASSYPPKDSRFISAKSTKMDLLNAIQQNPALIVNQRTRFKLIDSVMRSCKGFGGSQNSQYTHIDEDDDIVLQSSPMLPLSSY